MLKLKRIYEEAEKDDGFRVLVDRLWPRGVTKKRARLDLWMKDIAPSSGLRKWFAHDLKKWILFRKKYEEELKSKIDVAGEMEKIIRENKNITILYAAKDKEHNEAVVIKEFFENKAKPFSE